VKHHSQVNYTANNKTTPSKAEEENNLAQYTVETMKAVNSVKLQQITKHNRRGTLMQREKIEVVFVADMT
jgi:hypothetical protein